MGAYLHVEITASQSPKKAGTPCGDVWQAERTPEATTLVLADGIGSGVKANLYATMATSRLLELLRCGFSLRQAFASIVRTMHEVRGTDLPYAVLSVARILNHGEATVLTYEIPAPLLLGPHGATVVPQRTFTLEHEVIGEANLFLEPGDGLMLISDGITQAGLGCGLRHGWTLDGVRRFVTECRLEGRAPAQVGAAVHDQARVHWQGQRGDDCSVVLAHCRHGRVLNIMSGPPLDAGQDMVIANRFLNQAGAKVVCGATTARVVARHLGQPVTVEPEPRSNIAPPQYHLAGVDLVTEGAITLNQAFNILEANPESYEPDTGVTRLCEMMRDADRINFFVGRAVNQGHDDIAFRQRGILPRTTLIPLLAEQLRALGKLVVTDMY